MAKYGEGDKRWIVEERPDGANVHNWHLAETEHRVPLLFSSLLYASIVSLTEIAVEDLKKNSIMANSMERSFLQVAATDEVAFPLRVVQIEGLVILKIIKHCKEFSPALVTGQLLGLDAGSVLEVTNYFPFPIREEDEEIEADGANYQLEMMRCLREVNLDNKHCWMVPINNFGFIPNSGVD